MYTKTNTILMEMTNYERERERERLTSISPLGMPSKREGLIHPSTTNHPPKFTPLTFESPRNPSTKITKEKKWFTIHKLGSWYFLNTVETIASSRNHWRKSRKWSNRTNLSIQQRRWANNSVQMQTPIWRKQFPCRNCQSTITSKNPRNKEGINQNHKKPQIEGRGISLNSFLITQLIPKRTL